MKRLRRIDPDKIGLMSWAGFVGIEHGRSVPIPVFCQNLRSKGLRSKNLDNNRLSSTGLFWHGGHNDLRLPVFCQSFPSKGLR